jgi:hypothetical protein
MQWSLTRTRTGMSIIEFASVYFSKLLYSLTDYWIWILRELFVLMLVQKNSHFRGKLAYLVGPAAKTIFLSIL